MKYIISQKKYSDFLHITFQNNAISQKVASSREALCLRRAPSQVFHIAFSVIDMVTCRKKGGIKSSHGRRKIIKEIILIFHRLQNQSETSTRFCKQVTTVSQTTFHLEAITGVNKPNVKEVPILLILTSTMIMKSHKPQFPAYTHSRRKYLFRVRSGREKGVSPNFFDLPCSVSALFLFP